MEYGDKIGICEVCDNKALVQYSSYYCGDLCEKCWDYIAEKVLSE